MTAAAAAITLFVSAVSVGCFASFGDGWCVDIVVLSGFGCFDLVHAVTEAAIAVTLDNVRYARYRNSFYDLYSEAPDLDTNVKKAS